MLSTVEVKADGRTYQMKMGARAMMAVERSLGIGILKVFEKMQGDSFSVGALVAVVAAVMNDGKGGSEDEAFDFIDAMGMAAATQAIVPVIEAAFPEAEAQAAGATPAEVKPEGKKTRAA